MPGPAATAAIQNIATQALEGLAGAIKKALNPDALSGMVKSLSETFSKLGSVITGTIGSIDAMIGRFVALSNPGVYNRFQMAIKDLQATFGKILAPVLQQITALTRKFADAIINATPAFKSAVQQMASFAATATILAGKISALVGLVVGQLLTVLSPVLKLIEGLVNEALVPMQQVVQALQSSLGAFVDNVTKAFTELLPILKDLAASALASGVQGITVLTTAFKVVLDILQPVIKALLVLGQIFYSLQSVIQTGLGAALQVLAVALKPAEMGLKILLAPLQLLSKVFSIFADISNKLLALFGSIFSSFSSGFSILDPIAKAFEEIMIQVGDVIKSLVESFVSIFQVVGKIVSIAAKPLTTILTKAIEGVAKLLLKFAETIKYVGEAVSQAISYLPKVVKSRLGIDTGVGENPFPGGPVSSVGAAAGNASYTSFYELGQKQRQLAAGASTPEVTAINSFKNELFAKLGLFAGAAQREQQFKMARTIKTASDQ